MHPTLLKVILHHWFIYRWCKIHFLCVIHQSMLWDFFFLWTHSTFGLLAETTTRLPHGCSFPLFGHIDTCSLRTRLRPLNICQMVMLFSHYHPGSDLNWWPWGEMLSIPQSHPLFPPSQLFVCCPSSCASWDVPRVLHFFHLLFAVVLVGIQSTLESMCGQAMKKK